MNDLGFLIFAAAIGLLWSRTMHYTVWFLASEGLILTLMVWTTSPWSWLTFLVGLATLVVKAGLIPGLIHRLMRTLPPASRQDYPLPLWAYAVAVVVVLAVGHVIHLLGPARIIQHELLFFYALSSIHLGLVMIVARRHLLAQVASLVALENGLVVLAVSLAGALPSFVELGMLVDLGIAITLLVWMSHLFHHEFETTDVVSLRRLRG